MYLIWCCIWYRAHYRFAPRQWETSLQSNGVSQWLGTNLESALWYDNDKCMILIRLWTHKWHPYLALTSELWSVLYKDKWWCNKEVRPFNTHVPGGHTHMPVVGRQVAPLAQSHSISQSMPYRPTSQVWSHLRREKGHKTNLLWSKCKF